MPGKNKILIITQILALFISFVQSSFLILPLKSKKKNNIDLPFTDTRISQYLPKDFTSYDYADSWYRDSIFSEVSVSNPPQKIISEFGQKAMKVSLVCNDLFQSPNNKNYFKISNTYKNITGIKSLLDQGKVLIRGEIEDIFHFSVTDDLTKKSYDTKDLKIKFEVDIQYDNSSLTSADQIILKDINKTFDFELGILISSNYDSQAYNFIKLLKTNDLIDSYDFTVEFYKDNSLIDYNSPEDEIGRLIIGKVEQLYNKEKNYEDNIKVTKLIPDGEIINYRIIMSEIFMQNSHNSKYSDRIVNLEEHQEIEFIFDQNLIQGSRAYSEIIRKDFFDLLKEEDSNEPICTQRFPSIRIGGTRKTYEVIECSKSIYKYKDEFPLLKFYQFELDYTFEFTFDDLFREINNKVFFLVIFPAYTDDIWSLGKIFLKKYQLIFNLDSKLLKFYNREEEIQKEERKSEFWTAVKVAVEIILVVVIGFSAFHFGRKINKKMKLKAVELEETDTESYKSVNDNKEKKQNYKVDLN
ncbi:MAG: hypothetical protein MJ252_03065 [archaeon]|nr:hypothetical protein [archaeon]